MGRGRLWAFAAVCALAAAVVGTSIARAIFSRQPSRTTAVTGPAAPVLPTPPGRPFVMFRSLRPDETWSRIALAPLGFPDGARYVTSLVCERVYFAGSRGVCLVAERTLIPTFSAYVFDEQFKPLHKIGLTGPPSRTRLSSDGRRAAVTVFEQGHSYAEHGFSTRTTLIDTFTGASLGDLEQFAVSRDGAVFRAADFNFWGVSFARDGNRFFATLSSGDIPYLIEGNIDTREAHVMLPGIECPSLSPDNTRIAFKKRVQRNGLEWEIWLLDLATLSQKRLAGEMRSIDDQVDWLDDTHLLYHYPSTDGTNIWRTETDGPAGSQRFVSSAYSPAVVR